MNVDYLIQLLNNKLVVLNNAKIQSYNAGDLPTINALDEEILGVKNTLTQLALLQTINNAAASVNTTPTNLVSDAVAASQNVAPTMQGPSASAIVNGYDISAYATDPTHEQTIQTIVDALPPLTVASDIDTYIQTLAPGSPVTGGMIIAAATQYNGDIPLIVAIIQNDSLFGTLGIAVGTLNPGNVGNDGTNTHTFATWSDGVMAVAEWLSRHHANQ